MAGMEMNSSCAIEEFRVINGPILDIRSPCEYEKGHWPGSINLPLFGNEERAAIGTTYKKEGSKKAILLGLRITGPKLNKLV